MVCGLGWTRGASSVCGEIISVVGSPCHSAAMPKNYFDQRIAKSYDAKWPELFEPAAIEQPVNFLVRLVGSGAALA